MITKERLEELIKKGARIYSLDTKLYGCVKYLELENQIDKLEFNKQGEVKLFITDNGWWHWFSLKDLYESKEDVEEILEFGNITRTEMLDLPMWKDLEKDFDKLENGTYTIAEYKHLFSMNLKISKSGTSQILLFTDDEKYNWNLSRENYNEARRLCKKIFLGENL